MALTLVVEASTASGSVAVIDGSAVVANEEFESVDVATGERTEALAPAIARVLGAAGVAATDLTAVICGAGPGGFTSLRSAAANAKGICVARAIPLYAVSSLDLLALAAPHHDGPRVVALPAGRGEWFAADVLPDFAASAPRAVLTEEPRLISEAAMRSHAVSTGALLVGPRLDADRAPRAASAATVVDALLATEAVDVDSWEPAYGRLAEAQLKWEAAHGRPLTG